MSLPSSLEQIDVPACRPAGWADATFFRVTDDQAAPRYCRGDVLIIGRDQKVFGLVPEGSWPWFLESVGLK